MLLPLIESFHTTRQRAQKSRSLCGVFNVVSHSYGQIELFARTHTANQDRPLIANQRPQKGKK